MNQDMGEFFKNASNGASWRQMGSDSGISYSTIRRQLSGEGELSAHVVVSLARTYGLNVLHALTAAGFITSAEADSPSLADTLAQASDFELAHEIMRRARDGQAGEALTGPLGKVSSLDARRANVSGLGEDGADVPDNVEEEWGLRVAAHPDSPEPIDHDND